MRLQIEAALAHTVPAALTPAPRLIRPVASTGIPAVDQLLEGGLPLGAITEISGTECSGRSTLALSFLAQQTREGKVCAWIDVSKSAARKTAEIRRLYRKEKLSKSEIARRLSIGKTSVRRLLENS